MTTGIALNLLFLTHQGDIAGSTQSIAFLASGLAERKHGVFAGIRKESLLYKMLEGTSVVRVPMTFRSRIDGTNMRQIRDAVRDNDIQLVNAQSGIDRYTSILSRWRYKLPCKIVHTRRQRPAGSGGWIQNCFYTKGSDKIVVISYGLKQIFIEKGMPGHHLHVIHNGIPFERYNQWSNQQVAQFREKWDIGLHDKVIGCVSRMKKQEQIVRAVSELGNESVVLIFAGIKPGSFDSLAESLGLKNRIIYAGTVETTQVLNLYRLFDVSILASTMDGFGLVLLESMAMDCPVIATRAGGIPDVVTDEENGLLYEDGDILELASQMRRALGDEELRQRLIVNGRETACNRFTMENTIDEYERLFAELIGSNQPEPTAIAPPT